MKKHIVISAFSARRGGGKTYLRNLLKFFPDSKYLKVTILASKDFDLVEERNGLYIERISFPVHNPFLRVFWEVFMLPFYLRKSHIDIFFCPGGTIPKFGFGKWKTVTMFRNMIPFDLEQRKKYPLGFMRLRNWLLSKVLLSSMESAELVIFISMYARQLIEKLSKNGIKKAVTIPHGVSDDFRNVGKILKKRPSYFPNQDYIVYPSIIDVYKSQKEVVKAIAILRDQGVIMPMVLFTGEIYGNYGEEVRQLIKDYGLKQQVIIFGPVKYVDMPLLYHFADFVIFASSSENCPNILLEALASSRAVLCSNKMPMPEFAADAVEYFDPDDPLSIAEKIRFFLNNPDYISQLERMAAAQSEHYHWYLSAEKTWRHLAHL
jgi:glycosyltransferase involved in cell wall biosynthesis